MKVFTIKEISEYLKVSQQTIRQKVKELQKDKLLFVSYDADGRIRLDVEQVGILIATYYKSVYNVYCEMYGIEKGVTVIPTRKGTIQRLKRKGGKEVFYIRNLPLAYDHDGNEILYKSPKFKTKEDAETEQARLLANREKSARKLERETSRDDNALLERLKQRSFKEYFVEWVDKKEIRQSTKSMYLSSLKVFFKKIDDILLGEIQANIINYWLSVCIKNRHIMKTLILGLCKHLYNMDILTEQILKKIETVKIKPIYEKKPLNVEQVKSIFEYCKGSKYEPLIHLLFKTGLRIGEALALTKEDILFHDDMMIEININKTISYDRITNEVTIAPPKTESGKRIIYVNDHYLYEVFKEKCKGDNSIIFKGNTCKYISFSTFRSYLNRMGGTLNLKITPHITRHTYISIALSKGVDLYALVKQVGHSDPTMILKVYGKLIVDAKEVFKNLSIV